MVTLVIVASTGRDADPSPHPESGHLLLHEAHSPTPEQKVTLTTLSNNGALKASGTIKIRIGRISIMRHLKTALLCSVTMALATPVLAQTAPAPVPPQDEEATQLEDIVVTVERREQNLQNYAGTATALSGEDLKAIGVQDIADLEGRVPGLSVANNGGNIEIYIRGVGSSNNTELGDPAAATHYDGVYLPRPAGIGR
jgi:TonB-dependent Receptor Plug Domain